MLKLIYQENNINTANLYLREGRARRVSPLSPAVVNITGLFEPDRQRVEDFIKAIYKHSYDADISSHPYRYDGQSERAHMFQS